MVTNGEGVESGGNFRGFSGSEMSDRNELTNDHLKVNLLFHKIFYQKHKTIPNPLSNP